MILKVYFPYYIMFYAEYKKVIIKRGLRLYSSVRHVILSWRSLDPLDSAVASARRYVTRLIAFLRRRNPCRDA